MSGGNSSSATSPSKKGLTPSIGIWGAHNPDPGPEPEDSCLRLDSSSMSISASRLRGQALDPIPSVSTCSSDLCCAGAAKSTISYAGKPGVGQLRDSRTRG